MDDLSEEEMEVLPLDDTEQYYVGESESEGSEVGTKAWGSSKKAFYSQQELGLSSSDEAEEFEEKEAIELQDKMAAALSESDFLSVQALGQVDESEKVEQVALDVSKLGEEEKLALVERTSPELMPLIESLRNSCTLVSTALLPQLSNVQEVKMKQLIELRVHLNLCYSVNAMYYLLMKASRENTRSHPVFTRLLSLKQLISQVDSILSLVRTQPGPPQLSAQDSYSDERVPEVEDPLDYYFKVKELKRRKKEPKIAEETILEPEFDEDDEKRPISYQISRNKGLTPKRSKEQRNPRVKHRKKFKKALQKRKGQVLPVQTELTRYGGESTGIRSNVTRSVKIK